MSVELPIFVVNTLIDHPAVKGEKVKVLESTALRLKYLSKRKIETIITNETASAAEVKRLEKIKCGCPNCTTT